MIKGGTYIPGYKYQRWQRRQCNCTRVPKVSDGQRRAATFLPRLRRRVVVEAGEVRSRLAAAYPVDRGGSEYDTLGVTTDCF